MLRSGDLAGTAGCCRPRGNPTLSKLGHRQRLGGEKCTKICCHLSFSFVFSFHAFYLSVLDSRSIARVVSQVHAFQEAVCPYSPDRELQDYLQRRIARLATSDIHLLAADSDANFQQSSEKQTRRIQEKLRRVKASFQWALPRSHLTVHTSPAGQYPHVKPQTQSMLIHNSQMPLVSRLQSLVDLTMLSAVTYM